MCDWITNPLIIVTDHCVAGIYVIIMCSVALLFACTYMQVLWTGCDSLHQGDLYTGTVE